MKKRLKISTFPETSSDKIVENISVLDDIKQETLAIKNEVNQNKASDEILLLGELLSYIRSQKSMTNLILLRQVKGIKVSGDSAKLIAENNIIKEISENEKCKAEISKFLEGKGLSLKIDEISSDDNSLSELQRLLEGKLQII